MFNAEARNRIIKTPEIEKKQTKVNAKHIHICIIERRTHTKIRKTT